MEQEKKEREKTKIEYIRWLNLVYGERRRLISFMVFSTTAPFSLLWGIVKTT